MSGERRNPIPEDVAADVRFAADDTCCKCRVPRKVVQIHHIDDDRNNNSPDNLAVLCIECHNQTQVKGGFGRTLNAPLVRRFRDDWNRRVEQRRELVHLNEEQFKDFRPAHTQSAAPEGHERGTSSSYQLEQERTDEYRRTHGLFLVHYWRPSEDPEQVADIVIRLRQHNRGPLKEGKVESVEYQLGPKFFTAPQVITDPANGFELEVAAYCPMLCLARVHFSDGRDPLTLFRYVDFPMDGQR